MTPKQNATIMAKDMAKDTAAEATDAAVTAAIKKKEPLQNVVVLFVIFTKSIDKSQQI